MSLSLSAATSTGAGSTVSFEDAAGAQAHVYSAAGSSATVTIQGSLDGSTWVTLATITNPDATGEVYQGTALPYLRANVTARVSGTITAVFSKLKTDPGAWASMVSSATSTATSQGVIKKTWTNADVVALGATTTGEISVGTLPANAVATKAYIFITGQGVLAAGALTVSLGFTATDYIDFVVASDAKAAAGTVYGNDSAERGTAMDGFAVYTTAKTLKAQFVGAGNLTGVTGSTGTIYVVYETLP